VTKLAARLPDLEHWKAQVKCQTGCPVRTDAGRYVQLIADGRDEEAYLVARAPNPFASVCGRVCAAPCEDACRRSAIDTPVAIRGLKRFVTEQYGIESIRPDSQAALLTTDTREGNRYAGHLPMATTDAATPVRRKVAVVGAGPAGMSAAHDLTLIGYDVTVFEAGSEPGGMMRFGIPEYRLPRTLIRGETSGRAERPGRSVQGRLSPASPAAGGRASSFWCRGRPYPLLASAWTMTRIF